MKQKSSYMQKCLILQSSIISVQEFHDYRRGRQDGIQTALSPGRDMFLQRGSRKCHLNLSPAAVTFLPLTSPISAILFSAVSQPSALNPFRAE